MVIQGVIIAIEKVASIHEFVSDNVGPHREVLYQILLTIKKAQEVSIEALLLLTKEIQKTADKLADGLYIFPIIKLTLHR